MPGWGLERGSMRWVLVLLLLVGLGIALLPLKLATDTLAPGLEADEVGGSIWKGRLRNARYNGLPLGNLDVGLDPRRLLGGEASLAFTRLDRHLSGRIGGTRQDRRIEGLTGEVKMSVLPPPVPAAVVALDGASARFGPAGTCLSAGGSIAARLSGIPLLGDTPPLVGTPRCDGDALFAPLAAPSGRVGLDLRLWADGRWRAGLDIRTETPMAQLALAAAGFAMSATGGTYEVEGRLGPSA